MKIERMSLKQLQKEEIKSSERIKRLQNATIAKKKLIDENRRKQKRKDDSRLKVLIGVGRMKRVDKAELCNDLIHCYKNKKDVAFIKKWVTDNNFQKEWNQAIYDFEKSIDTNCSVFSPFEDVEGFSRYKDNTQRF